MRSIDPRCPGTSATDAIHRSETWKDISDRCGPSNRDVPGPPRPDRLLDPSCRRKDPCHGRSGVPSDPPRLMESMKARCVVAARRPDRAPDPRCPRKDPCHLSSFVYAGSRTTTPLLPANEAPAPAPAGRAASPFHPPEVSPMKPASSPPGTVEQFAEVVAHLSAPFAVREAVLRDAGLDEPTWSQLSSTSGPLTSPRMAPSWTATPSATPP